MKRVIILAALSIAACADPHEPLSADFGNSVRANIAAQVVNPNPTPPGAADTDAIRIQNAMRRYHTNTVYPPQTQNGVALSTSQAGPSLPPMLPTQ